MRSEILHRVTSEIRSILGEGVTRVAVDGVDGAGKTCFADELVPGFEDVEVIRSGIDRFHNPRATRYARGRDSPEGFYRDSFNLPLLEEHLLAPLSPGGSLRYRVAGFDHRSDSFVDAPVQVANPPSILIFDGIFSQRPELAPHWDYTIFLEVDRRESLRRCFEREGVHAETLDPNAPVHRRYVEGQEIYLRACDPRANASIVIDNNDLQAPFVV